MPASLRYVAGGRDLGSIMDVEQLLRLIFLAAAAFALRTYVRANAPERSETAQVRDDEGNPDGPKS